MSAIKAIDIVLIPPQEIYDLSLKLSTSLNQGIKPVIQLDDTHLPHITLVQLYIRDDRMGELIERINKVAGMIKPLSLKMIGLSTDSNNTAGIEINLSSNLNELYGNMLTLTEDFEEKNANEGFVLDPGETARPGTISWVANYRNKSKYNPHISLAKDSVVEMPVIEEREFIADRLLICQLGNFCTCRKIIKEWKLKKE